jgi:hypothetical protein
MEKNRNALFFTCSLIEFIGRETKNRRSDIVEYLGTKDIQQIYNYSDIFHCEPIAKVADDFINKDRIENGDFDNIVKCKYAIPDYWDIGDVFARLIEDCIEKENASDAISQIYQSWIADKILDFNSDFYYQSREYIALCYKEGQILE